MPPDQASDFASGLSEGSFFFNLEQPGPGRRFRAGEPINGHGWAVAAEGIASITVFLDEARLCQATIGIRRADLGDAYRACVGYERPGFVFSARLPVVPPRSAMLRFAIQTPHAIHRRELPIDIAGAAEPSQAPDSSPTIRPPARLQPIQLELEQVDLDQRGRLYIRGWTVGALATKSVEVALEETSLGLAQTLLQRDDVARVFTAYSHAATAGFQFAGQVDLQEAPRRARLTVIATDVAGYSRTASRTIELPARAAPASTLPAPMLARIEEARVSERGILRVRGWALSLGDIEQISVFLDNELLGPAQAWLPRNDVGEAYPDYPNSARSGFLLQREVPDRDLSDAHVRIVMTAVGGIRREIAAPVALPANIIRTQHNHVTHCYFDTVSLSEAGELRGTGWAVCQSGVAAITLTLGEVAAGPADIGLERPDVGNRFPTIPSARLAGFRFRVQLPGPYSGEHILRLVVKGNAGEEHSVLQPVCATAAQETPIAATAAAKDSEPIKFYLDAPAVRDGQAMEPVRGFLSLIGWAIARAGIDAIEVFVDGHSQGHAYYGIRREEVQAEFPQRDALLSGFAMLIPPPALRKGRHDVQIVLRDKAGHVEQTAFSIAAEPAAEGPGPWQLRSKIPQSEIDLQNAILAASGWQPAWLLLLPLFERCAGAGYIEDDIVERSRSTLSSLRHQACKHWRLRVVVGAGVDRQSLTDGLLAGLQDLAEHVEIDAHETTTLLADLTPADGMLTLLAPGDRLGEDALLEFAVEAATRRAADAAAGHADFIYSDERRIDPSDGDSKAFFKPDWSPDLLLSTNYIGRLWAASPALLRRAGLSIGDLSRHGEYDAVLRLTEQAECILHVTKVLCARGSGQLDDPETEQRALQRAAQRRGIDAEVLPGCVPGNWRFRRGISAGGMVSIIIPTIASKGLVKTTIDSIRARTAWPDYEIIVLDNIGPDSDTDMLRWKDWLALNADRVVEVTERFNWSRFNNLGADHARGDFLLFLNDDVEILHESWLHALVEHAQRPEVGVVGPRLLYPDGTVQHAGVFLSRQVGRHAFRFYPGDAPGPFGLAASQRNVISVTGACLMARREVFDALGGFDENHPVINNDLDFSLRARRSGFLVIYTPYATMTHHEMVSRSALKDVYDSATFDAAWKDLFLQGDPYFHPMLSPDYDDYLSEPEPLRQFQAGHPLVARDTIRRILAVKLDHIGDFIAAFPAFRRITRQFPHAELWVLAAKASLALAAMEPAIDHVLEFNFFHARSQLGRLDSAEQELHDLQERLAPLGFDLAIDLRRQSDTRKVLRYTGARWLAGFDQGYASPWLDIAIEFEGDVARQRKRSHVTDSLVHFIDAIAQACETDRSGLADPQSADDARKSLASLPALADISAALFSRPVVCVHTGAGAANKQWPPASFAGLIDLLVGILAVNVLIIGGPDEAPIAAEVMQSVRRPEQVFSLVARTNLEDLSTVLAACDLYVGNDSGPKHMAAALGVPTIGIHSGSVDAGEWGPMGVAALTMRRDMTCGPCYIAYAEDCPRSMACLHGISVGDVFRACRRMLALRRGADRK